MKKVDVIIIGAGAAGMMCAIESARRGRSVLLLDHAKTIGEKIRISGGGRCNFTNLNISIEKYISQNPHFALSALKRFTQWDFIDRIQKAGIAYHEKTLGQLFCDGTAKQVIDMLATDMRLAGVEIKLHTKVLNINKGDAFEVELESGIIRTKSLVVACGGKSIPKMGATGFGYRLAEQFGLDLVDIRPGLVPLTFGEPELTRMKAIAGNAIFASVQCHKLCFEEGLLFTHRGLSGPSILQISSYWTEGDILSINLLPKVDLIQKLQIHRRQAGKIGLQRAVSTDFSKAIAGFIVANSGLVGNLADQSDIALKKLGNSIHNWQIKPTGSEGYRTAEVTVGGVSTRCIDAKTMQARTVPGLYFIGEVVDVTGWLGGYNFQWAWSSGWVAGQVV